MLENQDLPYFFANGVLTHNSAYPHSYVQANLFSNNCLCCRKEEKYTGDGLFKLKGRYCTKKQGNIEKTIQWLYNKRQELKKTGDKREYAYKIVLNCLYGICGNPVFKNVYNLNTASDCTLITRTMIKLAKKRFVEAGYEFIYTATDSVYLRDPYDNEAKILLVKDRIIEEIKESFNFPVDTFTMGIDARIKLIYFPGLKKSNYLYVTTDGRVEIKGLPFWKDNASPMSMHVFNKYVKERMINDGVVKYDAMTVRGWINKELTTEEGLKLIMTKYKVRHYEEYKLSSQLQAQISKAYGRGIHYLIPNTAGVGVGKSRCYCTLEEFKNKDLTVTDIDLTKVYSELQIFSERQLNNKTKIKYGKKVVNNSLAEWIK